MESLLESLHAAVGDFVFIPLMASAAVLLSIKLIPITTDMMVNSAAGLAAEHLGRQYRTLVINASTNNPEVATMIIALIFYSGAKRIGGIGTPLGSNFANIYLIFLVALGWVVARMWVQDRVSFARFKELLRAEKRLLAWHFLMSCGMCLVACLAFRLLTGQFPIGHSDTDSITQPSRLQILAAAMLCLLGLVGYLWKDASLRKKRPELFEEIDEDDHHPNWTAFVVGTAGLVVACYAINVMFSVATNLYSTTLAAVLGPAVFAVLHYFLGALVTSLPEMNVAISNYRRLESPDLNTALASASASNMSNLAIAALGSLLALF